MKNRFLILIFCLLIFGVAVSVGWTWSVYKADKSSSPKPVAAITDSPPQFQYIGSVGYWWSDEGLVSLQANIEKLDAVNLYLYELKADGTVALGEVIKPAAEKEFLTLAEQHDKDIILGINNFGKPELLHGIFNSPAVLESHLQNLLALVEEKKYDGVAIDYESLTDDQTEDFTAYIKRLGNELHSRNKKLVVTVITDLNGHVWSGIDAVAISSSIDRIELQTFGEFSSTTDPGPVASIGWVGGIVSNAIAEGIPAEKITVGIAYTGNDWQITGTGGHQGLSTKDALVLMRSLNADLQWDRPSQSSFFEYEDEIGRDHIVWLEDSASTKEKIKRMKKYNIGGAFLWFIGGEDPRIWDAKNGIFIR